MTNNNNNKGKLSQDLRLSYFRPLHYTEVSGQIDAKTALSPIK
jgi:hypothetical protein